MESRPRNTFFDNTTDTAIQPTIRPKGAHKKQPCNPDILPAYTGTNANWHFAGWYAACNCGWTTMKYSFRGFAQALANRHAEDNR